MSINTDYRPVPTDLVQPQPVTTSYWRTFKITMKVTLPHVPGMLLLGTSAFLWAMRANQSDCHTSECNEERDNEGFLGLVAGAWGVCSEIGATMFSVGSVKKHIANNSINTPEGIKSLRDRLEQSANAKAFISSYLSVKDALIEFEIFTKEEMDQIERESKRYTNLVWERDGLNGILVPEERARRQIELDAEGLDILNSWACFKEKYLGKHCASSSSSIEQV